MEALQAWAGEVLTEHRGLFVTVFVLPISLAFDVAFALRAWVVLKLYSAPKLHEQRVVGIRTQILAWKASGASTKLCTSRGGWQSISPSLRPYKKTSTTIDVNLYDILELNQGEGWVRVEPMVNMGMLSHFLVPHGLTIPVLPEMDDLTVGGLLMGVGIETSSHVFGLFNDTVVEAELILASGEVVVCSKAQNRELFDALPWSYGTLGFLTSVKIRVIPSKPWIRIEYIPCRTQQEGFEQLRKHACAERPPQFVESLGFSRDAAVVMPANFCDAADVEWVKVNRIGLWFKPWFYKHVAALLDAPTPASGSHVEYIPTRDYYHRHTRSIFWELEQIIPWGNHPLFRLLLGWAVPPKVSFLKLTQTEAVRKLYETQHVIQDMLVPMSRYVEAHQFFHDNYNLYPLWICPYKAISYRSKDAPHRCFLKEPRQLKPGKDYEMYVDLGAYGIPGDVLAKRPFDVVSVSRKVEAYVESVHGFQMLYADSYQTREEFRTMFDHRHYDAMKAKYDPTNAFPEVYTKVATRALKVAEAAASGATKSKKGN
jgi:delta24-sterol reductase